MAGMLDNNDIAILVKVNELAERYAIAPCDFLASIRVVPDTSYSALFYEMPAAKNGAQEQRFNAMLGSLGIDPRTAKLTGTTEQIYSVLEKAVRRAPKPHAR